MIIQVLLAAITIFVIVIIWLKMDKKIINPSVDCTADDKKIRVEIIFPAMEGFTGQDGFVLNDFPTKEKLEKAFEAFSKIATQETTPESKQNERKNAITALFTP